MTESDYILPPIPTGEELEQQAQYHYDLTSNWLDLSVDYPAPRFLLEYGGVGFSPLGGVQAITGHQKNGKTFVMAQLMAAILQPDAEKMRALLPSLKANEDTVAALGHAPVVLYCDTEQEIENTARVARRVHYLCGWPLNEGNARFRVLWLRAEESTELRWQKVKQAIYEVKPTAIFLDGIRDVIGDFNDNEESANLIAECMAIATKNDCCMWTVLHENPGSEKMRGHLGTELSNKVSDTFVSTKEKKDGVVTFTVKQKDARSKDVDDWVFEITDDAGGLGIPRIITPAESPSLAKVSDKRDKDLENIFQLMKEIINPPRSVTFTELREALKNRMGVGSTKATNWISEAQGRGVLIKSSNKILFNSEYGNDFKESQDEVPF